MSASEATDRRHMAHALRLAARGLGRTHPNPTVGCVLTRQGRVVGTGWHQRAGLPHAEVEALRAAGEADGATAYVTLEPCSHQGRTPPCAAALIDAGIRRVVVAMEDPNPLVAGQGLARLRQAGISLTVGVGRAAALALVRPFVTWVTLHRPMVTLKAAASLDGKIATRSGESQWITGPQARQKVHRLRDIHDAVLVGIGTVLADDPQLNCRLRGGRDPVRVVVDSRLRLPLAARVVTSSATAPLWVATSRQGVAAQPEKAALLGQQPGVVVLVCGDDGAGRISLPDLLGQLAAREITSVLSEAGGRLSASLLAAGLVDRLSLFLAPRLIGDRQAAGILDAPVCDVLARTPRLASWEVQRLGDDLWIHGDIAVASPG